VPAPARLIQATGDNPVRRHELLREGSKEIAKVFIVAVIIDLIYEIIAFTPFIQGNHRSWLQLSLCCPMC
jgi:hypothetical protein